MIVALPRHMTFNYGKKNSADNHGKAEPHANMSTNQNNETLLSIHTQTRGLFSLLLRYRA